MKAESPKDDSPGQSEMMSVRQHRGTPWENVPQNKFLLRIGWGEGGRRPDEVNHKGSKFFDRRRTRIDADKFPAHTALRAETKKRIWDAS